jgi:hypothetical protein
MIDNIMNFVRLDTVYLYCIDTYGVFFVEKYLVNPLTSAQPLIILNNETKIC